MKTLDEFLSQDWPGSEASFANAVSESGEVSASQQHINKVRRGRAQASPALAKRIEAVTGGVVSKATLRPDLWEVARSTGEAA